MNYRRLRIAWSVGWGLLAVPLGVLWVRSYFAFDICFCPITPTKMTAVGSVLGAMSWSPSMERAPQLATGPLLLTYEILDDNRNEPWFWFQRLPTHIVFRVPYFIMILPVVLFGTAPWFAWQFSLRALLIATTLVAVVLGLIIYMTRQ
jgi:hypothetical protein